MLSILIPVYNSDVRKLVKELHDQCTKAKIIFEILCFDDDSQPKYKEKNRELGSTMQVSYIELSENQGRSKIRNLLAKNSRYDFLLFLDSDSKVKGKKYIKNYIVHFGKDIAISGGRIYNPKKPSTKSKILHWTYGSKRECPKINKRNRNAYLYFHSNNFVIPRILFNQVKFDTSIQEYGYEDLVFGQSLKDNGYKILHIENPIVHSQLKTTDDFMNNIDLAIQNLAKLYYDDKLEETRLIKMHRFLVHREWLEKFEKYYRKFEQKIENNLDSDSPNLYFLDMYKLYKFNKCYSDIKNEER